jgi:metal-responsive CopG/Arc/MetJ family transcriptional regulator
MTRTTILLESDLLLEIRQLARASGKTATAIIREALKTYLEQQRPARKLSFTAIGKSGRRTVSKNAEAILRRKADRRRGW